MQPNDIYNQAAEYIKSNIPIQNISIAVVLGSGLSAYADKLEDAICLPYADIPGFPTSSAPGHKNMLCAGYIDGRAVFVLSGRCHVYEGNGTSEIVTPIRALRLLGVDTIILTNAAGGVNTAYKPGDFMIINDHINFLPNPLIGKNLDEYGVRFPDMTFTYDQKLREMAAQIAKRHNITAHEGVYVGVTGPSYETPAEIRAFRTLGADAVGMSTVPEAITARHCGMRVLGISLISNCAAGILAQPLTQEEVIQAGSAAAQKLQELISDLISAELERE